MSEISSYSVTAYSTFLAVFLEEKKIAVSSSASFINGSTKRLFNKLSSMINSNQKYDSSASSITILNLDTKLAFDWAMQEAL